MGTATDADVFDAVCLLAELSKHEMFLKSLGKEYVLRALVDRVLQRGLYCPSVFVVLRQVLTSQAAGDGFTAAGGLRFCLNWPAVASVELASIEDVMSVCLYG